MTAQDILLLVRDFQLPTLLALAGVLLIILALLGRIGRALVAPKSKRRMVGLIGLLLLAAGLAIYVLPLLPLRPPSTNDNAPSGYLADDTTSLDESTILESWAVPYRYEFPKDWLWSVGPHSYTLTLDCPGSARDVDASAQFAVSRDARPTSLAVYLRPEGPFSSDLLPLPATVIHPSQPTLALVTLIRLDFSEAQALSGAACVGEITWDFTGLATLVAGEPYELFEDVRP